MELTTHQRSILARLLSVRPESMAGASAIVAEALTDCDEAPTTLLRIASLVRIGVRDDSTAWDAAIGRAVRQAVTDYAIRCGKQRADWDNDRAPNAFIDFPVRISLDLKPGTFGLEDSSGKLHVFDMAGEPVEPPIPEFLKAKPARITKREIAMPLDFTHMDLEAMLEDSAMLQQRDNTMRRYRQALQSQQAQEDRDSYLYTDHLPHGQVYLSDTPSDNAERSSNSVLSVIRAEAAWRAECAKGDLLRMVSAGMAKVDAILYPPRFYFSDGEAIRNAFDADAYEESRHAP